MGFPNFRCLGAAASKPDVFGISYKPYKKKSEEYNMPSGPAFADEAEFEKELSESFTAKASLAAAPLEDEFDFDGSSSSPSHTTSSSAAEAATATPVSAIKRALETAAERAKREAEAEAAAAIAEQQREALLLAMKNKVKAAEAATAGLLSDTDLGETHLKSGASGSLVKAEADKKKSHIMEAAKQALDDVMNVYGSGLGDHSIRVMEATDALSALPESSIGR
jgi:hypothetical protein